jgi:L-threonylcarbamoyladenylate synthase
MKILPGAMRATLIQGVKHLTPAVQHLRSGGVVGIPTETVYGLAANALDPAACAKIFHAKGRPIDNPLIVHVSSMDMLKSSEMALVRRSGDDTADIPTCLLPLLERYWPGPLTVLLPKGAGVPDIVTASLDTVAVRMPSHPVAREIIEACGFPLAAPSANLSGRPSPTSAQHVQHDLGDRITFIVDGGPSQLGLESTVLDATQTPPLILRPGSVTLAMVREYMPNVKLFGSPEGAIATSDDSDESVRAMLERPSTPGMKYKHYAPECPLHLFASSSDADRFVEQQLAEGGSVARLLTAAPPTKKESATRDRLYDISLSEEPGDLQSIARNLFSALREADQLAPTVIVAVVVSEPDNAVDPSDGEALAIMNRLSKAAHFYH